MTRNEALKNVEEIFKGRIYLDSEGCPTIIPTGKPLGRDLPGKSIVIIADKDVYCGCCPKKRPRLLGKEWEALAAAGLKEEINGTLGYGDKVNPEKDYMLCWWDSDMRFHLISPEKAERFNDPQIFFESDALKHYGNAYRALR